MTLEPPRKRPEWKEARGREEEAWRLEPEGETEVPMWTLMVKATMDEGKSEKTEVKVACWERKEKQFRARRENNSVRIRRDARFRKRSKEHGSGRSGRTEFRTECDQCSAKDDISLR